MNILCVEDDPISATLLKNLLSDGLGCKVSIAGNVFEGIRVLETERNVGLVICDIHLPGSSGLVLIQQLRSNAAWRDIPILVCTGDTNRNMVVNVARLGLRHFLAKPVNRDNLREKLRHVIDQNPVAASRRLKTLLALNLESQDYDRLIKDIEHAIEQVVGESLSDISPDAIGAIAKIVSTDIWEESGEDDLIDALTNDNCNFSKVCSELEQRSAG